MNNLTRTEITRALESRLKIPPQKERYHSFLKTTGLIGIAVGISISTILYAKKNLEGLFTARSATYSDTLYAPFTSPAHSMYALEVEHIKKELGDTSSTILKIFPYTPTVISQPSSTRQTPLIQKIPETHTPPAVYNFPSILEPSAMRKVPSRETKTRSERGVVMNEAREGLEERIATYAQLTGGTFVDNEYFRQLRFEDALMQLEQLKDPPTAYVFVINKTFQKAIIFKYNPSTPFLPYYQIKEVDCSTAKIYGKKQHAGDGKTPEGIYLIKDIWKSDSMLYEGKRAYGPYAFQLLERIWGHGNGSVTIGNIRTYQAPEPLGVHHQENTDSTPKGKYNFGYGRSHGCIRFDNTQVQSFIKDNIITQGTPFIIFENRKLTKILRKTYGGMNETYQKNHAKNMHEARNRL